MAVVELQGVVDDASAGRLDQAVRLLTGRSWSEVRGMIHLGCVTHQGAVCRDPGAATQAGDAITIRHDPHTRYKEPPRERASPAFRLVHEDDDLIVVDKGAAWLTVPSDRGETNTLVAAVSEHLARRQRGARAAVVHRLDRGTSGLLVFGKSAKVAQELQAQFRVRKAEREYATIVAGNVAQESGTLESRLGTSKSLQRYSVRDEEEGEDAVTHYRVAERLRGATYLRVRLETGRRNQIRVHFAEFGYPVLGDERYRPDLSHHPAWRAPRLALHAALLGFQHPRTQEALHFNSPLPDEFTAFFSRCRGDAGSGAKRKR